MNNTSYSITLNGYSLGTLNKEYTNKAMKINGCSSLEELAWMAVGKALKEENPERSNATIEWLIKKSRLYMFDSPAQMLDIEIIGLSRTAYEICKNCDSFYNGFCLYRRGDVDAFEKGCKGWADRDKEKKEDNVMSIAEVYCKNALKNL